MAALQHSSVRAGLLPVYRRLSGFNARQVGREQQLLGAAQCTSVQGRHRSSRSREYLQESVVPSYHFQPSMPRLPVPKLSDTCGRYLASQQPMLDSTQLAETTRITREFEAKEGAELHNELLAMNEQNKHTSYISGPWFDMYLKSRLPVVLNYNPFMSFVDDPKAGYTEQLVRATNFVVSSARFMKSLREELLKPEIFHLGDRSKSKWFENIIRYVPSSVSWYGAYMVNAYPLDMSQYKNLLNSTRVPGIGRDEIVKHEAANHLLVIRNGHMYVFDVLDADGNIKPAAELQACLKYILSDQSPPPSHPLGYLTAENRDTWAGLRQKLLDCGNEEALKTVDSAIFCMCLDDGVGEDPDSLTRLMLHGDAANRWFDKSFSLIIDKSGTAAINFEHAWGDGVGVLRYFNEVFDDMSISPAVTPSCEAADIDSSQHVRKLEFNLDGAVKEGIETAKENFFNLVKPLDLGLLQYSKYGKNDIKKYKVGPDAIMQLAIQMGYHRLTGKTAGTYESCSTAAFKHGRTETVRPCTSETRQCSLAFDKVDSANVSDLRQLIQACSDKHNSLTKNAAMGQGWDRHLFALLTIAEKNGGSPAIFQDPAFAAINHFILSTSTLNTPALQLGSFAPVVPNGYGIGYGVRDRELGYNITSYPASLDVRDFVACIESSLDDLFNVLYESSKASSETDK